MNKKFIYFGFIIPPIFWATIFLCGLMTENYSHATNMVSELGAIGTSTQYIFSIGLVLSSILSVLFIIGLYNSAKEKGLSIIPILIIFTFSFSIFGAAIYPLPLRLHGILGSPSMLLPLSPLFALLLWKSKIIEDIKLASGFILLFMALGFLVFVPGIFDQYFGLKQRIFHVGWTIWFVYLSQKFVGLSKQRFQTK